MYRVYGDIQSGNCYKVKLLMHWLALEHEWIHIDIVAGETHTAEFLRMNPAGRIPVLAIGGEEYLSESNAILNYLAEGSPYLPSAPMARAKVLQWQFFEQYSHEPYIAVARYINRYLGLPGDRVEEYKAKQAGGHRALGVMEQQLSRTPFLAGEQSTIADISLYAYTHVAHEGGFVLDQYPAILGWIDTIGKLPRHIPMDAAPEDGAVTAFMEQQ